MGRRTQIRNAASEPQFKLFAELKRRNIFRVAATYVAAAWLIVHVGYVLSSTLDIPKWVMQFIVSMLTLGFPAALAFAWAFEITPKGIKRTREVPRRESSARSTGRKLDFAIIAVLAAALGFVVLDAYVLSGGARRALTGAPSEASIAVLPFADLSPAKDHEYFSDGISEELLNRLSKVERFKVAGRTSSFAFKGKNEDLRKIGEQLGVESILEGSVRKEADRIRVTAQLIDVHDGSHLWSDSYDRQLKGIFEIQDDIAREVVAALTRTLLSESDAKRPAESAADPRPTLNTEAYNSYLRGQHLLRKRAAKDLEQAVVEFGRATKLDPGFALAHVGLSNAHALLATYGWRNIADVTPVAESAIAKALDLNPQLADAHAARYLLLSAQGAPRRDRLLSIKRAMELNPNDPQTLGWYSGELANLGTNLNEARRVLERAYELDPLAPHIIRSLAYTLYTEGERERAEALAQELATLTPGGDEVFVLRAWWAISDGRLDNAIRWMDRALDVVEDNTTLVMTGVAYECLGDLGTAKTLHEKAHAISPSDMYALFRLVKIHSCAGEPARSVKMLSEARQRYADDPYLKLSLVVHDYCMGQPDSLVRTLHATHPELFLDPPELDLSLVFYAAPYAVFAARQTGDFARAEAIAGAFYSLMDTSTPPAVKGEPDWMRARIAAAMTDRGRVLKYLDQLYDSGSVLPAWVDDERMFAPIAKEPAVAERLKTHAARRKAWRQQLADEGL